MSAPFHWCHSHDVTNGVTAWPYAATYGFVMTIPRLFFFWLSVLLCFVRGLALTSTFTVRFCGHASRVVSRCSGEYLPIPFRYDALSRRSSYYSCRNCPPQLNYSGNPFWSSLLHRASNLCWPSFQVKCVRPVLFLNPMWVSVMRIWMVVFLRSGIDETP